MNRDLELRKSLAEVKGIPFEYGQHDCALFVDGWLHRCGGPDRASEHRGRYSTMLGGQRRMRKLRFKSYTDFITDGLKPVPVSFAQVGDIALIGEDNAFGIVAGERVFALRKDGMASVSLTDAHTAYRVEF